MSHPERSAYASAKAQSRQMALHMHKWYCPSLLDGLLVAVTPPQSSVSGGRWVLCGVQGQQGHTFSTQAYVGHTSETMGQKTELYTHTHIHL